MGWSDESEEQILQYFGFLRDPPKTKKERKSKIKKLIREELNKNPVLSNVLKENKAEGKFVKELTDKLIRLVLNDKVAEDIIHSAINSKNPVDQAINWRHTKQGFRYWNKINDIVIDKLSK